MTSVVAAALAAHLLLANHGANDRSDDRGAERWVEAVFASAAEHGVVITEWEQATPLWFAQRVEDLRPDLRVEARGWRPLREIVDAAPPEALPCARSYGRGEPAARRWPGDPGHLPATGSLGGSVRYQVK